MPLPSPAEARGASNRRSRRTPSTDSNAASAAGSVAAAPRARRLHLNRPRRPVRHAHDQARRAADPPAPLDRQPLAAERMVRRGDRHLPGQRRVQLTQSVMLVVPGRKTDVSDAAWLCQLAEAGLLRGSFVPPKPIRQLRNLTRYRKTQIQERSREANRLHKALEDSGIKLDCVATDILGRSGRAMLEALVAGTTDPELLADLARGKLRKKIPALREALAGRFDHLHAVWVGAILNHIDFLDGQIAGLTETIGEQIVPFEQAVELLCTIPGVQRRTAETIIAEIGIDMSVFPTAKQLASWAGQCPGNDQSAGKRRSGRTRKGSKWLDWALEEAAMAAIRTRDIYLAAQYARLRPRRGHKKALGAVKHSILCACWHMLTTGELYRDLGGNYFQRRDPERTTRRLIAQLEALGHTVTLKHAAA